jgi:hypothetical protein
MRRIAWPIVVLAVMTAMTVPGTAAAAPPAEDTVYGLGVADTLGTFAFAARSGPSGEAPTGFAALGPLQWAPISCVAVTGNVARIDVVPGRISVQIEVTDNAGRGVPDVVRGTSGLGIPANCDAPVSPDAAANAVVQGDIIVVDAAPGPVSRRDCRRGGWRRFGFKNRRQCLRAVGQQPPG